MLIRRAVFEESRNRKTAKSRLLCCLFLIFLFCEAGCSHTASDAVTPGIGNPDSGSSIPPRAQITGIPYYEQEASQCGPAALSMVSGYYRRNYTIEELSPALITPEGGGSLATDMFGAARRLGFVAFTLAPDLHAVLREVAAGRPVIVLMNLGFSWYPVWHYGVITGYDLPSDRIVLRSGRSSEEILTTTSFEHVWGRADRWTLLVLPAGELRTQNDVNKLLPAAYGLERAKRYAEAGQTYAYITSLSPEQQPAWIGWANSLFSSGRAEDACNVLAEARKRFPRSSIVFNNSAHILASLHRYEEALPLAMYAAGLSGPAEEMRKTTLAEVELGIKERARKRK